MKSAAKILIINFLFSYLLLNTAYAQEILTWQDCLAEAEKNNPDLISAVQEINIQKAAKAITVSGLFPQTSANVDASTAKTTAISSSDIATSATNDSYSYGLSANQLIFDGFKTFNDIGAASENVKAAQHAYRFASSEVRLKLRTAFVDLLKTQELIKVIEEIVKIRKDSLTLISQQYQAGLEHKGALMIAEANLAEANFELSQAKRKLETAQRQLSQAMGRQEFRPISVKGEFIVSETAKEKPNFEELVKNNPQVSQAIAKENSSLYGIKSAYGNFAPKISGSASKEKKGAHWDPENDQWNLALTLTMPLFEGGLKTAQLSRAKAIYNQAIAERLSITNEALTSLEQMWSALQDSIENVDVQFKLLTAYQERSNIARGQYSIGLISFDNWIIIEDGLVSAKKSYLNAQVNALLAEANWIQAKGETLEYAQ